MRILSCKISNFGCYSDMTFDFEKGLNPFCLPNGGGKTTLASFIKAMLYSLEKTSKTSFERNRYRPYSGKECGGSMIFEFENATYRIERTFGSTPSKDILKIYDERGVELTSFQRKRVLELQGEAGKQLGEMILGIDEEAFKRCNFIAKEDLDFASNESIKMKIGNIVIDKESENSYEDTVSSIEGDDLRTKAPTKKNEEAYPYRIDELKKSNKIKADRITELDGLEKGLDDLYEKRSVLKKDLADIEKRQRDYSAIHVLKGKYSTVEQFDSNINAAKETIDSISAKYGGNILSKEEVLSLQSGIKEVENCQNLDRSYALLPSDIEKLKQLKGKVLSDEDYEKLFKASNKLEENRKRTGIIPIDLERYEELKKRFEGKEIKDEKDLEKEYFDYRLLANKKDIARAEEEKDLPSENVLLKAEEENREYERKKEEFSNLKSSFKEPSIFLEILLTILTLGLYLFVSKKRKKRHEETIKEKEEELRKIAEGLDAFFAKYEKTSGSYALRIEELRDEISKEKSKDVENASEQMKQAKKDFEEKERAMLLYFSSFGYESKEVGDSYEAYRKDLKEYKDLLRDADRNQEIENSLTESDEKEDSKIASLLGKYGLSKKGDLIEQLKSIKDDIEFFKKNNPILLNKEANEKAKENHEKTIASILLAHGIEAKEDLLLKASTFLSDTERYNKAKEAKAEQIERKEAFIKENGLEGFLPTNVEEEEEELRKRHEGKNNELSDIDNKIAENERQIDERESLQNEIADNNETIKEYKEKIRIAEIALSLLEKAEKDMEDTYINPIKDSFSSYASKIYEKIGMNVTMDYEYQIKYEIEGQLRESKNLSDGERTIMMLALRFAVLDAMYKKRDSFIVLDDPFESLDEERLPKAKELLKTLSKDWQIIYFTCHESRKIDADNVQ